MFALQPDLTVELMGLRFKNPVWIGACDATRIGNVESAIKSGAGAVVLKSVSELLSFQNKGITRFVILDEMGRSRYPAGSYTFFSRGGPLQPVDEVLKHFPAWKRLADGMDVRLIGSVNAGTPEGWERLSAQLAEAGVDALELNFGNPHARHTSHMMGLKISQAADHAAEVVRSLTRVVNVPIIAKISPHAPDVVGLAQSLREAGAVAVTVMHRFQGLIIDVESGEPVLNGYNGIGGPWVKPLALYWTSKVHKETGCPVIGGNGIDSWSDAAEFLMAGARAVQVASSVMVRGYGLVREILDGLMDYLRRKNISRLPDLIGSAVRQMGKAESVAFPERRAVVNPVSCAECPDKPCLEACFFGAMTLDGAAPAVNDNCNGCGLCAVRCPYEGTITFA